MAFHRSTPLKMVRRALSASWAFVPNSLALIVYKGLCVSSAVLSISHQQSIHPGKPSEHITYQPLMSSQNLEDPPAI